MKKIISLVLVFLLMFSVVGFADSFSDVQIDITRNETSGNDFIFEIEYFIDKGIKGESFIIEFPFDVKIVGKNIFHVENLGSSKYKLTFKKDYNNVRGVIGGKKTAAIKEDLKQLVINGEVIDVDYNAPEHNIVSPPSTERDPIYKHGVLDGDRIFWSVYIAAPKEFHLENISVRDLIGDGQEIDTNSVKFSIITKDESGNEQHNIESHIINHAIEDLVITDENIDFTIRELNAGEAINIVYYANILDHNQSAFSNQLIIQDEEKITETVYIEDWSDVDGEEPEEEPNTPPVGPEQPDPEDPKPEQPTDPTLPQVGESYFKTEYMFGFMLIMAAFTLKRYNRR